jgi:hypothetical protein
MLREKGMPDVDILSKALAELVFSHSLDWLSSGVQGAAQKRESC